MRAMVFSLIVLFGIGLWADVELKLIRRVAVFPIGGAQYASAEDTWWQMREALTKDPKLMVASRRLMVNRGVFQPRESLRPADVVILGKILDAQALIVSFVQDRTMVMKVYESDNGYLLWQSEINFHPALPIQDQLIKVGTQLTYDFMMAFPYQGFQVQQSHRPAVYEMNNQYFAKVFVGEPHQLAVGDAVQWLSIVSQASQGSMLSTAKTTVIAEGAVHAIDKDSVEVAISKMQSLNLLKENALVRFPQEQQRLTQLYQTQDRSAVLSNEYLSAELKSAQEFKKNNHPTTTALAFIASLAAYLLIAF